MPPTLLCPGVWIRVSMRMREGYERSLSDQAQSAVMASQLGRADQVRTFRILDSPHTQTRSRTRGTLETKRERLAPLPARTPLRNPITQTHPHGPALRILFQTLTQTRHHPRSTQIAGSDEPRRTRASQLIQAHQLRATPSRYADLMVPLVSSIPGLNQTRRLHRHPIFQRTPFYQPTRV